MCSWIFDNKSRNVVQGLRYVTLFYCLWSKITTTTLNFLIYMVCHYDLCLTLCMNWVIRKIVQWEKCVNIVLLKLKLHLQQFIQQSHFITIRFKLLYTYKNKMFGRGMDDCMQLNSVPAYVWGLYMCVLYQCVSVCLSVCMCTSHIRV